VTTTPTNDALKAILTVHGEAGLARQLDGVYNVDAHLDHALYNHLVFLKLGPCQHCILITSYIVACSIVLNPARHSECTDVRQFGTARERTTYHEPLRVSIYPPAFAPCLPNAGFNKSNPERSKVCFNLKRPVWHHFVRFFTRRSHHSVHKSYQVFCRFGLYSKSASHSCLISEYIPCRLQRQMSCSS
jgi:hypothetical protein